MSKMRAGFINALLVSVPLSLQAQSAPTSSSQSLIMPEFQTTLTETWINHPCPSASAGSYADRHYNEFTAMVFHELDQNMTKTKTLSAFLTELQTALDKAHQAKPSFTIERRAMDNRIAASVASADTSSGSGKPSSHAKVAAEKIETIQIRPVISVSRYGKRGEKSVEIQAGSGPIMEMSAIRKLLADKDGSSNDLYIALSFRNAPSGAGGAAHVLIGTNIGGKGPIDPNASLESLIRPGPDSANMCPETPLNMAFEKK